MKSLIALIDVSVISASRMDQLKRWLLDAKEDSCLDRVYMIASTKDEQEVIERVTSLVLNIFPQVALTTRTLTRHDNRLSFALWGVWLSEIRHSYLSDSSEVVFISSRKVFQLLSEQLKLGFDIQCENLNGRKTERTFK